MPKIFLKSCLVLSISALVPLNTYAQTFSVGNGVTVTQGAPGADNKNTTSSVTQTTTKNNVTTTTTSTVTGGKPVGTGTVTSTSTSSDSSTSSLVSSSSSSSSNNSNTQSGGTGQMISVGNGVLINTSGGVTYTEPSGETVTATVNDKKVTTVVVSADKKTQTIYESTYTYVVPPFEASFYVGGQVSIKQTLPGADSHVGGGVIQVKDSKTTYSTAQGTTVITSPVYFPGKDKDDQFFGVKGPVIDENGNPVVNKDGKVVYDLINPDQYFVPSYIHSQHTPGKWELMGIAAGVTGDELARLAYQDYVLKHNSTKDFEVILGKDELPLGTVPEDFTAVQYFGIVNSMIIQGSKQLAGDFMLAEDLYADGGALGMLDSAFTVGGVAPAGTFIVYTEYIVNEKDVKKDAAGKPIIVTPIEILHHEGDHAGSQLIEKILKAERDAYLKNPNDPELLKLVMDHAGASNVVNSINHSQIYISAPDSPLAKTFNEIWTKIDPKDQQNVAKFLYASSNLEFVAFALQGENGNVWVKSFADTVNRLNPKLSKSQAEAEAQRLLDETLADETFSYMLEMREWVAGDIMGSMGEDAGHIIESLGK